MYLGGFPDDAVIKNSPANAGDAGLISGSGRSPEKGNGNLLQYSCLGKLMDRGAWWAMVHGVTKVGHDLANKLPPHLHDLLILEAGKSRHKNILLMHRR